MTAAEMVVVVVGLAAGWWSISALLDRAAARKLRRVCRSTFDDKDLHEAWPMLLQVRRSAAPHEIDWACRQRQDELRKCFPAVMTDSEIEDLERGTALLERARGLAAESGRRGPEPDVNRARN